MKPLFDKIQRLILFIAFNILVVAVILILIEGTASFALFFRTLGATPPIAERSHTKYDEELGWVNRPNVFIEDMYGPNLHLRTNAQGFRNDVDFSPEVPDQKLRVICSGDSFTLGYGVDNDHTWCQLLASLDERLQTVNMGQGGYGFDQAYLWYKRDGTKLRHDVHLFTFITDDFERMQYDSFLGYGKPLLTLEAGNLVVENVPVPQRAFYIPWLTQNSEAITNLKTVQLLSRFMQNSAQAETLNHQEDGRPLPEDIGGKIVEELQQLNAERDSVLVLVYLPTLGDYAQPYPEDTERWRRNVYVAANDLEILLIDLVDDFRRLPADEVDDLFLREGEVDFPGAAGHYSMKGNEYVAQRLHEALLAFPEVASKLAETVE